ncbi:MAG: hypothetical protein J6N78_05165 [Clostridia bacterium]|nr:hypothetical protein [Clostridia bacterium]
MENNVLDKDICSTPFEDYIYSSLYNYFRTLSYTGHVKKIDVAKLIILDMVEELLSGSLSTCLKEEDMQLIDNILYNCLYGSSCLLPYPMGCVDSCVQPTSSDEDIDENNILPPVIPSYWDDDRIWKDKTIWSDRGIYI